MFRRCVGKDAGKSDKSDRSEAGCSTREDFRRNRLKIEARLLHPDLPALIIGTTTTIGVTAKIFIA